MVIIKLRNELDWYKANWVFRRLAEDVISTFPDELGLGLANAENSVRRRGNGRKQARHAVAWKKTA
jgi:hypothetical protein